MYYLFILLLLFVNIDSFVVKDNEKFEGSPCKSGEAEGVCVPAHRCLTVLLDIQNKTYPPICSYQGDVPIVCCTDCELVANSSYAVITEWGDFLWRNESKGWNKCLDYLVELPYECKEHDTGELQRDWDADKLCYNLAQRRRAPVGGEDAGRGEFPHMALLGYGEDFGQVQWQCGGSLISEQHVLTAAHCKSSAELGPVRHVVLGVLRRGAAARGRRCGVLRFESHPLYHSPLKYHDIAVIVMDAPVQFDKLVLPACLPYLVWHDAEAEATGWGALGPRGPQADTLQKVTVKKFNESECAELYSVHRHLPQGHDAATQMCFGDHRAARDTCEGDSGGPLQVHTQLPSCVWTLLGVASFGRDCGVAGVYTRVHHYIPWIEGVVWP